MNAIKDRVNSSQKKFYMRKWHLQIEWFDYLYYIGIWFSLRLKLYIIMIVIPSAQRVNYVVSYVVHQVVL